MFMFSFWLQISVAWRFEERLQSLCEVSVFVCSLSVQTKASRCELLPVSACLSGLHSPWAESLVQYCELFWYCSGSLSQHAPGL